MHHNAKYAALKDCFTTKFKGHIHVLTELSERQYKRCVGNTIHVSNRYSKDKKQFYTTVSYGINIKKRKRKQMISGQKTWTTEIMLRNTTNCLVYIITNKIYLSPEIERGDIHTIDGTTRCFINDDDDKYRPSGMILLCVCKLGATEQCNGIKWGHAEEKILKSIKTNTITATNRHHGSHGGYFLFGNKAFYGKVGSSSVSQYAVKASKNRTVDIIEELFSSEVSYVIDNVAKNISIVKELISPVVDVAYEMQRHQGDINLKEVCSKNSGIWKTSVTVDAYTKDFRTENDCTYTVIHVPMQVSLYKCHAYHFQFALNEKHNISIPLHQCTTILFSAKCLTHRQTFVDNNDHKKDVFINFGAYGNQQLFNHMRKTFVRNGLK